MNIIDAMPGSTLDQRSDEVFSRMRQRRLISVDRTFAILMVAQWIFAIVIAFAYSPYAWEGKVRTTHTHVWAALLIGGALTLFPVALAVLRPGWAGTRHVMAISQMLWSALLIHLTGGRIETHFHVFGSLAFLAAYVDWRVLISATLVVAGDHLARGLIWPESVYGITNPEWWRVLEHVSWVAFENVVLAWLCITGIREMRTIARKHVEVEVLSEAEQAKSEQLEKTLADLSAERDLVVFESESRRAAEAFAAELVEQSSQFEKAFLAMQAERDAAVDRTAELELQLARSHP